jgi:hypothetical protein
LVDGADVVVHGLDLADADNRAVLGAIRRLRPERRVVVEATASGSRDHHEVLEGCAVLPFPMRTGTLVDAIEHALDPR